MSSLHIAEFIARPDIGKEIRITVDWEKDTGQGQSGYVVNEYQSGPGSMGALGLVTDIAEVYTAPCGSNEQQAQDMALTAALKRYRELRDEGQRNFKAWQDRNKKPMISMGAFQQPGTPLKYVYRVQVGEDHYQRTASGDVIEWHRLAAPGQWIKTDGSKLEPDFYEMTSRLRESLKYCD